MNVDFANTCAWLDALYCNCTADDGNLVIVSSDRNKAVGCCQLGSGDCLVEAARQMHRWPGCYLKINPMDGDKMKQRALDTGKSVVGNRNEVKTVVSFHLDVDAGKGQKYVNRRYALWAISQMPKPPTMIINSKGEDGGFHVYWMMRKPHRITNDRSAIQKQAEKWNARLKEILSGKLDTTCNLDRVLRCVGVPRKDGGRVCMHNYEPGCLYDIDELVVR